MRIGGPLAFAATVGLDRIAALLLEAGGDPTLERSRAERLAGAVAATDTEGTGDDVGDPDIDEDEWERSLDLPVRSTLSEEEASHYAWDAARARLRKASRKRRFRSAVKRLERSCGADSFVMLDGAARRVHVDSRSEGGRLLREGIDALLDALEAPGCLMVMSRHAAVLLPTNDPLEALAAYSVSGPNEGIELRHVLAFVRDVPMRLHEVRSDLLSGRLDPVPYDVGDPESIRKVALRLFSVCPDVLYQRNGPLPVGFGRLCAELRQSPIVRLWWD